MKLAASDPWVARIFIFLGAKVAMCKSAKLAEAGYVKLDFGTSITILFTYE